MEGVGAGQRQEALAPGEAAVARIVLGLLAAAADVVGGGDDQGRIPEVDPDVRLAARHRLRAGDAVVGADGGFFRRREPFSWRGVGIEAGSAPWISLGRHQVLVEHHPLGDLLQHVGVAAGRIGRRIVDLRVVLAPVHAQPERHRDLVAGLRGPQHAEILIVQDQLLERGAGLDVGDLELLVGRRPGLVGGGGAGGARGEGTLRPGLRISKSFKHRKKSPCKEGVLQGEVRRGGLSRAAKKENAPPPRGEGAPVYRGFDPGVS